MKTGSGISWLTGSIAILNLMMACDRPPPVHEGETSAPKATVEHVRHWGYGVDNGPAVWAELSDDFSLCRDGRKQSPIDLVDPTTTEHPGLEVQYRSAAMRIIRHEHVVNVIDNGHTIQVNYDEGSTLTVGNKVLTLAQYHFHAPSEHTVDGRHYPMEMHLVHQGPSGELAVLGVLIEEGAHNAAFDPVWAALPDEIGEEMHLEDVQVNVDDLLPADRRTYRYSGSLTTPPCSEGVSWFVAVEPISLSAEQVSAFTAIISDNNRPTQPINERSLAVDRVAGE